MLSCTGNLQHIYLVIAEYGSLLFGRKYTPSDTEIVYHYCPADAFLALSTTKRLRCTDVFSMNDFMEMHWGHHIWTRTWAGLQEIPNGFLKTVDELLFTSGLIATPLATCFSLEGDTLSQWRAYANDGTGYSVGFQAQPLTQLAVRPLRVLYDESDQISELQRVITALYRTEQEAPKNESEDLYNFCLHLMLDLAAFKNPAFQEEKEIRLLHTLRFEPSGRFLKLRDPGGIAFGSQVESEEVQFLMRKGIPVPYIDIPFQRPGEKGPIRRVIIGPKNQARTSAVSVFLESIGIHDVDVVRSTASYR